MAASDEAELVEVQAAISRILSGGQEIERGDRRTKQGDLATLYARRDSLERRIARAGGTRGVKTVWSG